MILPTDKLEEIRQVSIKPLVGKGLWVTTEDFTYVSKKNNLTVLVPKGFITDLATIPKMLRWLFPKCHTDTATASIVHDWILYLGVDRSIADDIFKEILDDTASEEIEEIFYNAVSSYTWINKYV